MTNSQVHELTRMDKEDEFAEKQIRWLCHLIAEEMSWQIVEILVKEIRKKNDLDVILETITSLDDFGILINESLLSSLRDKSNGDSNIWLNPDLFHINTTNFAKAHAGIKKIEKAFNLKNRSGTDGFPKRPSEYRRAVITRQAENALLCIKERFITNYPTKGLEKYQHFVRQKILANVDLWSAGI